MEQSDIDELIGFVLANGNTDLSARGLLVFLAKACQQTAEKCARMVERQAIHSIGEVFAKSAPMYTISEMNSILAEIAAEIRLAGWK